MADDVQLTDLEVIQRYSLAVRGASASRADLISALQADLEWLRGGRRSAAASTVSDTRSGTKTAPAKSTPSKTAPARSTPAKSTAKRTPAKRAPAKRSAKG